jgi:hypothetical protein
MDWLTVLIFVVLVFTSIGAWVVFGFIRYRRYFMRVRDALMVVGMEDIWHLPTERLADVDDVVRRCYFAKAPLPVAASRAIEVLVKAPEHARSDAEFKPSIGDPRMLILFIPMSMESMSDMWRRNDISTTGKSAYSKMREATEHTIYIYFYKVRLSWLKTAWLGNIRFNCGSWHVDAGSISGRTQAAMWRQLRQFMEGDGRLYDSTSDALMAVSNA